MKKVMVALCVLLSAYFGLGAGGCGGSKSQPEAEAPSAPAEDMGGAEAMDAHDEEGQGDHSHGDEH